MAKRSHTVGLPVTITVDDDGTVTYEVDWSEAGEAVSEDYNVYEDENGNGFEYDEETLEKDGDAVQAWVNELYGL